MISPLMNDVHIVTCCHAFIITADFFVIAFVSCVLLARQYMTMYYDRYPQETEIKNETVYNFYCHMVCKLIYMAI